MKEKNYTGLIPDNREGREITAESKSIFGNEEEARIFYRTARERLLFVHNWGKITGRLSADFQLTDDQGKEVDRLVKAGDHFRIDITGPGSKAGEGYDWARVEDVREMSEPSVDSVAILVRPAPNPKTDNPNVAHFFSKESTSTFVITREGNQVIASIYDRNIQANEETEEPLDKVRNSIVGLSAKHGLSGVQWQALCDALVRTEDQET